MQLIAMGLILVAVGYVLRGLMFGPSANFVLRFDGANLRIKGEFPSWLVADLNRSAEYLFFDPSKALVWGVKQPLAAVRSATGDNLTI
jgi:hypothetical protein